MVVDVRKVMKTIRLFKLFGFSVQKHPLFFDVWGHAQNSEFVSVFYILARASKTLRKTFLFDQFSLVLFYGHRLSHGGRAGPPEAVWQHESMKKACSEIVKEDDQFLRFSGQAQKSIELSLCFCSNTSKPL